MDPMIENGQPAPDFTLEDLDGEAHSLSDYRGRTVIVNFWSAECPWARRADEELAVYVDRWEPPVAWLSIASNANETPDEMRPVAAERDLPVVLHDPDAAVADRYGAQTTPHLFVIDPEGILRYQGAFDDLTFRQEQPTRPYLRTAVDAVLDGLQPDPGATPPYGCALVRHAAGE